MLKGVVLLTHIGSQFKDIVKHNQELLRKNKIELVIAKNGKNSQYEMLAIKKGIETFDEFVVIQDSCYLKNTELIEQMLNLNGPVFLTSFGYHYFNKYVTEELLQIELPKVSSKAESVEQERVFNEEYRKRYNPVVLYDNILADTDTFEEVYGRRNMIIENRFFKKYKGTWCVSMIK